MNARDVSSEDPVVRLGAASELGLLRERVAEWLERVDDELRAPLASAFGGTPKSGVLFQGPKPTKCGRTAG